MSHLKNGAAAQLRITPVEKSDAVITCDDDPAVLTPLERLLASDGFSARSCSFNKPKSFVAQIQANPVPVAFFTKLFPSDQFLSTARGALAMHPVQ